MEYRLYSFDQLDTRTLYEILAHRFEVFVLGQRCIYHDFDGLDQAALHLTARDEAGTLQGYVRLLPAGLQGEGHAAHSFGRLSVKEAARRQGVGGELVRRACALLTGPPGPRASPPWPIWNIFMRDWGSRASRTCSTKRACPM